ncbi:MAG: NmrA family NAD(P)-binding protein [Bacteroidales bacterium]
MKKILVTGATGNIGYQVIRYLFEWNTQNRIIAGVRNIEKGKDSLSHIGKLEFREFDFENPATFDSALEGVDRVFLLRPPHISNIKKHFRPLIAKLKEKGIHEVVFLSVQGAERSRVIPHHKIERLINVFNLDYIFLRPSYFMQNLTTTLINEIQKKQKIILPAGKAKFNWIDANNIGVAAAILLEKFEMYKNQAYELTGYENEDFYTVTRLINQTLDTDIQYESVNPIRFYRIKRKDWLPKGKILVMLMLHFLPRFQREPHISGFYEQLTGKKPTRLKAFIERERDTFSKLKGWYRG